MPILLIDNDDSFTFNLFQQVSRLGAEVEVQNYAAIHPEHLEKYTALIISPGPKGPTDYTNYAEILKQFLNKKPVLGVCLGHQILAAHFGRATVRAPKVMHGKTSLIHHTKVGLFKDIADPMKVARYHSLIVSETPSEFKKSAWTDDGILMAMTHKTQPIFGVQFHPESFLTEQGDRLIQNFLDLVHAHS